MTIKAIAVDDEFPSNEVIKRYCSRIDYIDLAGTFTDESAALLYLTTHPVDLIFLDIDMRGTSGIEFAKTIPKQTLVVFISAYSEGDFKHDNLNAFAWLTKPVSLPRFTNVLNKVKAHFWLE